MRHSTSQVVQRTLIPCQRWVTSTPFTKNIVGLMDLAWSL
jgi:hypothetical protein